MDSSKCTRSHQRWYRCSLQLRFIVDEKKTIKKTQPVDEDFLDNGEKTLRFHTKIDTCGRDLTANIVEGKRYVRRSLMASNILM